MKIKTQLDHLGSCVFLQNVSLDLVQFPRFVPQMPLSHFYCPLNREFGKIRRLEESHEDATQNGDRVPGICRDDLIGRRQSRITDVRRQLQ